MRKARLLLPLCTLLLGGCSASSITTLTDTGIKKPTPAPTAAATAAPAVLANSYNTFAGNCPDAADADVALITYAASQNYNMDMQLRIKPTQGCDADLKSKTFDTFRRQVVQASLLINVLDYSWSNSYTATRDTFLISLFQRLQTHYPGLSNVSMTVAFGGNKQAVLTYNGQGQPQVADPAY